MHSKLEIIVFAGPNGSGKSTIAKMAKVDEMLVCQEQTFLQLLRK